MNEPLEKPSATAHKSASAREEEGPASAVKERWYGRLKRLFVFRGKPKASPGDTEEPEARRRGKSADTPEMEAPPLPRRRLRSFLLMLAVALPAGALGAGITYSLLANIVKDQAAKLDSQKQANSAFQLREQAQALKLAELVAKLDAEHALRLKAELGDSNVKEPQAATSTTPPAQARPPTAEGTGNSRPSRGSTFRPPAAPKVTDCNLANGDAAALKRCLDDFKGK